MCNCVHAMKEDTGLGKQVWRSRKHTGIKHHQARLLLRKSLYLEKSSNKMHQYFRIYIWIYICSLNLFLTISSLLKTQTSPTQPNLRALVLTIKCNISYFCHTFEGKMSVNFKWGHIDLSKLFFYCYTSCLDPMQYKVSGIVSCVPDV